MALDLQVRPEFRERRRAETPKYLPQLADCAVAKPLSSHRKRRESLMEWDTPMDRMLRERAAKAREKAAKALKAEEIKAAGIEPESEAAPETIIIMPGPQQN